MRRKERLRLSTHCLVVSAGLSAVGRDIVIRHKLPRRRESVGRDRPAGRIMSKWPDVAGLKLRHVGIFIYIFDLVQVLWQFALCPEAKTR